MTSGYRVEGADRLIRTLGAAGRKATELAAANRDVANTIRSAAHPPRLTGRLEGSLTAVGTATEATVSSSLPYAGVIENGWPAHGIAATHFLAEAVTSSRSATLARYQDHCRDSIAAVEGA